MYETVTPALFAITASRGRWTAANHLLMLSDKLTQVAAGELKRLMVFMPPRHGKSSLISQYFPAWYLGHHPDKRVILTSYEADFAATWGWKARNIFEEYAPEIFGLSVRSDSSARNRWDIVGHVGGMNTAGVGGAITGKGADLLLIDDPVKNAEDANSEIKRDKAWDWYQSTAYTRLEPDGAVILIMCIAEGTRVLTVYNGWQHVENLNEGDVVWSFDIERQKMKKNTVKAIIEQYKTHVMKIKTSHNSIEVTREHPFLAARWNINDPHDWYFEWVEAKDLEVGDWVVTVKSVPGGYRKRIPKTTQFMDNDFMWFLGFMFGDGWVTRHVRKNQNGAVSYAVCCAIGIDDDLTKRSMDLCEKWLGTRPYITKAGYWRLDKNSAGRLLVAIDFFGKAKTKRIPRWVFNCRAEGKRSFLQGILDADGHKLKVGHSWKLVLANKDLVDDCRLLAMTCGVRATLPWYTNGMYQPPCSPEPIFAESWSSYIAFLHDKIEMKTRMRCQGNMGRYIRVDKIKSIEEKSDFVATYDVSLDGPNENFIADGFVIHNTRWHPDDLGGILLKEMDAGGEQWDVLKFPAIAEENDLLGRKVGDPLWKDRYPVESFDRIRSTVSAYWWAAMYQQTPYSRTGGTFKRQDFIIVEGSAQGEQVRFWDLAATEAKQGKDPDWTVGCLMSEQGGRYWIKDIIRVRLEAGEVERIIRQTAQLDGIETRIFMEQEGGASGKSLISHYARNILKGYSFEGILSTGSKPVRAQPLAAAVSNGNVHLIMAAWNIPFLDEAEQFPTTKAHDDQVDAASQAFNLLYDPNEPVDSPLPIPSGGAGRFAP